MFLFLFHNGWGNYCNSLIKKNLDIHELLFYGFQKTVDLAF